MAIVVPRRKNAPGFIICDPIDANSCRHTKWHRRPSSSSSAIYKRLEKTGYHKVLPDQAGPPRLLVRGHPQYGARAFIFSVIIWVPTGLKRRAEFRNY